MDALNKYIHAAHDALWAVNNGVEVAQELKSLQPMESELRAIFTSLYKRPDPRKGAEAHAMITRTQRAEQPFLLVYNGGGNEEVIGWDALAKRLRLGQSSIRVYLSKGKGSFHITRYNPLTHEPDMLTITRVVMPGEPSKPKIGRPRTRPLTEQEYLASTGQATEFAGKRHAKDLAQ